MSQNEKEPTPPSNQEHSVYVQLRRAQAEFGTVQKYVGALQERFRGSEDHTANILQFRRMAKLIVTPEELRHDAETTNEVAGFYVGELLGLDVCEIITSDKVTDTIYRNISKSYHSAQIEINKITPKSLKINADRKGGSPLSIIGRSTMAADYLLGELETDDGNLAFGDSEQFLIEQWASELAPDDYKIQECIIHGFAFVVNSLRQRDVLTSGDIAAEDSTVTEPDQEQGRIDTAFSALTDGLDFEVQEPTLESCAEIRAELLGQLDQYLETFEDIDGSDTEEAEDTLDVINAEIKRDFERLPGLELNDEVVAYGDSFIIIHDPEASPVYRYQKLSDSVHAKGKVGDIEVMMIPSSASMDNYINIQSRHTSTDRTEDDKVFGLMLRIDDVAFLSNKATMPLPKRVSVYIPLNYRRLTLMRIKYS